MDQARQAVLPPAKTASAYVLLVAASAAIAGLLFGYDTAVIDGAQLSHDRFLGSADPVRYVKRAGFMLRIRGHPCTILGHSKNHS
jgi:hypothetical protein